MLQDVPPYVTAAGYPAKPAGTNNEGLRRRGFSASDIATIRRAYKTLYRAGLSLENAREALATLCMTAGLRDCLAFEVARTRARFASGLELADLVDGRLRREVRLFAHGGLAILDRIEAHDYDVLAQRPTLGRGDFARLVWKELWR